MTSVSDAEILDTVRRLRNYMTTLDNCHLVLTGLAKIDDQSIKTSVSDLVPDLLETSKKTAATLKIIENSKSYREMLKKFNLKESAPEIDED